jgi:predicted HTH transcriptional regulator
VHLIMALIDAPISVSPPDLLNLLSNRFRDIKTIDYKLGLPGNSEKDDQEFLRGVSSFANASGGDLIYGMKDDGEVVGVQAIDLENEIVRLATLIRTEINPRIPNIRIQPLIVGDSREIVVRIRIEKSWLLPHAVKFSGSPHFYSRNSVGPYELDTS